MADKPNDTPRTDAAELDKSHFSEREGGQPQFGPSGLVLVDFVRSLERELAEEKREHFATRELARKDRDEIERLKVSLSDTPSKWIACAERLPEPGVKVLVWYRASYPGWRVSIGEISCDHWRPEGGNGNFDDCITHWMPLPEAPK